MENIKYRMIKFYMFNGPIAGIQVINRLSASKGLNSWYDENWNQMISITSNYKQGKVQPAPKCLSQMIEYAKKLSKVYKIFARIDFYATDKGAVFGEFTPTPAMRNGFTPEGDILNFKAFSRLLTLLMPFSQYLL